MKSFRTTALSLGICLAAVGCSDAGSAPPAGSASSTVPAPSRPTVVEAAVSQSVQTRAGRIAVRSSRNTTSVTAADGVKRQELAGRWVLPRVISGGPPDGVTPDGRFAALVEPARTQPGVSRIAVLDLGGPARRPRVVSLAGDFTYDAWSPDGSRLYLIEHRAPAGSGRYVVRALDVRAGTLQPAAVADKRTQGEEMAGVPVGRAGTRDGRSVATLYLPHPSGSHGAGHEGLGRPHGPFIHLLFTDSATALCVDLPAHVDGRWRMTVAGSTLRVAGPPSSGPAGSRPAYLLDLASGALRTA